MEYLAEREFVRAHSHSVVVRFEARIGGVRPMTDNPLGGFFISDADDGPIDDDDIVIPAVVLPQTPAASAPPSVAPAPAPVDNVSAPPAAKPVASAPRAASREERLANALNELMDESQDVEAAALVSLDGFTMASALPAGMHEDRVGAMSAAILGLGERAAAELGRGQLSQVFIEGDDGYVVLIAAGDRAVLTCLASVEAKLGLVLYDMRVAADHIAEILG
jgi:predicted regulator of Ras-like GTPase activity (Roadblock/LC7/MglB family)